MRATRAEDQALLAAKAARTSAEAEKKAKDEAVPAAGRAEKKGERRGPGPRVRRAGLGARLCADLYSGSPAAQRLYSRVGKSVTLREALDQIVAAVLEIRLSEPT